MNNAGLEALAWLLIYSGLLVLCLGVFLHLPSPALGWSLIGGGTTLAAAGALLVWLRSRRH